MLGRNKKKQKKGWSMDELENVHVGIRERLGSNTKLWVVALIAVIITGAVFTLSSFKSSNEISSGKLIEQPVGNYLDSAHTNFAVNMAKVAKGRGEEVQARFLSDRAFKLVVPCDISADEMSFLSRTAARGIWRKFRVSAIVWTYTEDVNGSNPKLTSRTEWSEDVGDFVVKMDRSVEPK